MSSNLSSINLAKENGISSIDKFINWALAIGRLLIIITEVIAVAAFIYRFSLDERLVNLHTAIKQKQAIVVSFRNDENKYRNLQDRIALAKNTSEKGTKISQAISNFGKLIPGQIKINNLAINKGQVSMNLGIAAVPVLADLINTLKSYEGIKSISIDSIENNPSVGLSVTMTTVFK
jgi:hypothetical protein